MKYLVTMTALDNTSNNDDMLNMIENQVIPAFDRLIGLEKEGRIKGGTALGQRKVVFVADVDGPAHLDKVVRTLPIWGMVKTEVVPLHDFTDHITLDKEMVKNLKK